MSRNNKEVSAARKTTTAVIAGPALCPSWQWHRAGSRLSPVRTLPVAPLWCDLGFFPNSCGNKAAANLRPRLGRSLMPQRQLVLSEV